MTKSEAELASELSRTRARVAELEVDLDSTNAALALVTDQHQRDQARVAELEAGRTLLPYCPRCCRIAPAEIHTCTPTPEWRAMEARVAELEADRSNLLCALQQIFDRSMSTDCHFGEVQTIALQALHPRP